jgi:hypothetical protein
LRDLDDEMSRQCRVAEIRLKGADSSRSGAVEEACKTLEKCQETVRETRQALLEYDGFLHAQMESLRGALDHPRLGGKAAAFFGQVGDRLGSVLDQHVNMLVESGGECLRGLAEALQALAEGADDEAEVASSKDCLKAIKKAISVSEKAIEKAVKMTTGAPGDATGEAHLAALGYQLTAKGLPPEFLENAQKKKDEAAAKKDAEDEKKNASHGYSLTAKVPDFIQEKIDERENGDKDDEDEKSGKKAAHGYVLTADSRTPGNESKGPVEEGEEDEGWVPGHRTNGEKKATVGYQLTV